MNEKTVVAVTNRSTGIAYYVIPEMNIRREYQPNETKRVSVGEIAAVCSQPGGRELLYNYFIVQNTDIVHETMNIKEEPEYWLTASQIPTWLNSCTIDEFSDALNYAPEGVKDLIKKYSISVPLNDMNKRELVKDVLGFDVTAAIKAQTPETEEEKAINNPQVTSGRKTTPNYKIVTPKK